jgi:hypothetical protein
VSAVELRPEESRCALVDLIRATQLRVLFLELTDPRIAPERLAGDELSKVPPHAPSITASRARRAAWRRGTRRSSRLQGSCAPSDSAAVGDSSYLEFVAPHLLKETLIHSSVSAIDQKYGNPYWCGQGLAASKQGVCGA